MRKKLITALATKFSGVEARVLGRIADNLMHSKTIESDEDVNSAVEEVTFADILKSYGDSRAAEASKTAVSNYEKKHGLKDGKPASTEDDGNEGDDDDLNEGDEETGSAQHKSNANSTRTAKVKNSPEMAAMMKMMKALGEKFDTLSSDVASIKQGKVTEGRKSRLNELIKGLTDIQKKPYNRLQLEGYSDEEFDALIDEITDEVAELGKGNKAGGNQFSAAQGGNGHEGDSGSSEEATDAEIDAVIGKMKL